jgi:hypothetical protein
MRTTPSLGACETGVQGLASPRQAALKQRNGRPGRNE